MRLKREFFNRPTLTVARELLGKFLVRKMGDKMVRTRITETEAYCGPKDKACHASKGLTPRTKVMFGPPGHAYVYLIYGMYHCLNIVTEKEGYPAAVLIRGVQGMTGPGKLCRKLEIDKRLNAIDMTKSRELWVEDRSSAPARIKRTPRIGVDYAGEWKDKPWRFILS
jgi:DNA-3-methyladenine glycosylase